MAIKKVLTKTQKEKIQEAFMREINADGSINLCKIPRMLRDEFAIEWKEYSADIGTGAFKKWLGGQFSLQFDNDDVVGMDGVSVSNAPAAEVQTCLRILKQAVEARGSILLATVDGILKRQGIQYKTISGGKSLRAWLNSSAFSAFYVSEDGLRLYLRNDNTLSTVPLVQMDEETKQMHSFMYLGRFTDHVKQLRTYTGYHTYDENKWRKEISGALAKAALGMNGGILDARSDETPRLAFDSGYTTANDVSVFCVLQPNPANTDGSKQDWILEGICYPDDDGENVLGKWLIDRFPVLRRRFGSMEQNYGVLENGAQTLQDTREQLAQQMEAFSEAIENGEPISAQMLEAVKVYHDTWTQMRDVLEKMSLVSEDKPLTLEYVHERLRNQNDEKEMLQRAIEAFCALADLIEENFVRFRFDMGDVSVMQKDKQAAEELYAHENPIEQFETILAHYEDLCALMPVEYVSDEIIGVISRVCEHFTMLNAGMVSMFIFRANDLHQACAEKISLIRDLLKSLAQTSVSEEKVPEESIEPETLLENVFDETTEAIPDNMLSLAAKFAHDDFERCIAQGRISEALLLVKDDVKMNALGYDAESLLRIRDVLDATAETLPKGMSLFAVSKRLLAVVGNAHRTVEKYLILGLRYTESCVTALLDLYRAEWREDGFLFVWRHCGTHLALSDANQSFLLKLLAKEGYDGFKGYLDKHIPMLYSLNWLESILSAAEDMEHTEWLGALKARMEVFALLPQPNAFVQALIDGNSEQVHRLADAPQELAALGYGAPEQEKIRQLAMSEYPEGMDLYSIGMRLYAFCGNAERTAEFYLWRALLGGKHTKCSVQLLNILSEETRWAEVCALYECYIEELSGDVQARGLYLLALLHNNPRKGCDFIRMYLQDCLNLMWMQTEQNLYTQLIAQCAEGEDAVVADFYGQLLVLSQKLSNELVRSVTLLSRDLRDLVTQREKLSAYGLSASQIENCATLFKTDAYSHERNAFGIAERLYRFVGVLDGVAEAFAKFDLAQNERAADLLWKIYGDLQDANAQFELIVHYPDLRETYKRAYLTLLLQREDYDLFLEESADIEEPDAILQLQILMAQLRKGTVAPQDISFVGECIGAVEPAWIAEVCAALAHTDKIEQLAQILVSAFDRILNMYDREQIDALVTADGVLEPSEMEQIQMIAMENGNEKLAIYYYTAHGVGNLDEVARNYYQAQIDNYLQMKPEVQPAVIRRLEILYSNGDRVIAGRLAMLNLDRILASDAPVKHMAQEIGELLAKSTLTREDMDLLMQKLQQSTLGMQAPVYTEIERLCTAWDMQYDCLLFFHELAKQVTEAESAHFIAFLCDLYLDAFTAERFPAELLEEAEAICRQKLSDEMQASAALCLYYIELRMGRMSRADYVLLMLSEQSAEKLGEKHLEAVRHEMNTRWQMHVPDLYSLFITMLENVALGDIMEYCRFCNLFAKAEKDDLLALDNLKNLAEDEANYNTLLKLLYCYPTNAKVWDACAKLPLEDSPVAYAKLLYHACCINPNKTTLWEKSIDFCEKYGQDEVLLQLLADYAKLALIPYGLLNCRASLARKVVNNPAYFERWGDAPQLLEIVEAHCSRLNMDKDHKDSHTAIKDVTSIALATKQPSALECLLDHMGRVLFGVYRDMGFAIACNLLLNARYDEAHALMQQLSQVYGEKKYQHLLDELVVLDVAQLEEWTGVEINRQLLGFVPQDGNQPKLEQIQKFAINSIVDGCVENGAILLQKLLEIFPSDYGCYVALFVLCKQMPNRWDMLHQSLCGMVRCEISQGASFFFRGRKACAILLAYVKAVISAMNRDENSPYTDETYKTPAHELYGNWEMEYAAADIAQVIEAQERTTKLLLDKDPHSEAFAQLCSLIYAIVCGEWANVLLTYRTQGDELWSLLALFDAADTGFARGALRAVYTLDEQERDAFIEWIGTNNIPKFRKQRNDIEQLYAAQLYPQLSEEHVGGSFFAYPFEEFCMQEPIMEKTVQQLVEKEPEQVAMCTELMYRLTYQPEAAIRLYKLAEQCFIRRNDVAAHGIYSVLAKHKKKSHFAGESTRFYQRRAEQYDAFCRITGVFISDPAAIEKVSGAQFNSWSCINMITMLLMTPRADELSRLRECLAEHNKLIADAILKCVTPSVSDEEKLSIILGFADEVVKGYLCFLFRISNQKTGTPYFMKDPKSTRELNNMYNEIRERRSEIDAHYIQLCQNIHPNAFKQTQAATSLRWETVSRRAHTELQFVCELPAFAKAVEPLEEPEADLLALSNAHAQIKGFTQEVYAQRLALSERIYRIALSRELPEETVKDYLLRFGVDYYYTNINQKNRAGMDVANTVIKELTLFQVAQTDGEGYRALVDAVRSTALHELLHKGYKTMMAMVEDFEKYRIAFVRMRDMIIDTQVLEDVNQIYAALGEIVSAYYGTATTHIAAQREGLMRAKKQLGEFDHLGWTEVKMFVAQLIQEEINRIDQRPMLYIEVLSDRCNAYCRKLFGQVHNNGRDMAQNVCLQVNFSNGSSSKYTLDRLDKGGRAAFEIRFEADDDVEQLDYEIRTNYGHKEGNYNAEIYKGTVTISPNKAKEFETNIYDTRNKKMHFTADENGDMVSPHFFGRSAEKAAIRALFKGDDFADYKDVMIRGVRRSGKTTMLHYMKSYAQYHCKDAYVVMVDCQGITATNCIQYVFIKSVLNQLASSYPELTETEAWVKIVEKWTFEDEDGPDVAPDVLQYFYLEFKNLVGKGIILIIDEFDTLLERVGQTQGVDSALFPSLGKILCSDACKDAVHLMLCGSNQVIRYSLDGGTLNQLFQRFGDNVIEIGRLGYQDICDMLTTPYKDEYPHVRYTKAALEWIWNYTGGLVWYTKLLGNFVLAHVKSDGRSVVYPYDVCSQVNEILKEGYCRQLLDSCEDKELKVVMAMQSLTARATEYVSVDKIATLLDGEVSREDVEMLLNKLIGLQMVSRNPYDRQMYRFAVEFYWYYFRTTHSPYTRVPELKHTFDAAENEYVIVNRAVALADDDDSY